LLEIQRENPYRWHEIVKEWHGVSEETTTGVHRLYKMHQENRLLVPAHQRERFGHKIEVRQSLRLPSFAGRWIETARST